MSWYIKYIVLEWKEMGEFLSFKARGKIDNFIYLFISAVR